MELDVSRSSGPHAVLARMVGQWRGTARLWLEPDVLTWEDTVEGRIEPVLDGRFVRHDYTTPIDGDVHTGIALIGASLGALAWQVAWVDTFHNGTDIMLSTGPIDPGATSVDVLGSYGAPAGPPWGWRTTMVPSDGRLRVRHFNITPEGREALGAELDYSPA
jgi:hypothetical protein